MQALNLNQKTLTDELLELTELTLKKNKRGII
jgi:hypothetical protein